MIDPVYLFVLDGESEVYDDGCGPRRASRVAAGDYHADYWYPSEEQPQTHPAYKAQTATGSVYIRETDVAYIVDLTDDEFRPIQAIDRVEP
jgi:hypothetical protein